MFYVPRYFTEKEFVRSGFFLPAEKELAAKYAANPLSFFDSLALQKLDQTRELAAVPFILTCSYRSRAHDISKGRSGNSAHGQGCAFDIKVKSNSQRYKILQAAIVMHWPRIGVYKDFIHLDCSTSLPQHVCWYV